MQFGTEDRPPAARAPMPGPPARPTLHDIKCFGRCDDRRLRLEGDNRALGEYPIKVHLSDADATADPDRGESALSSSGLSED